MPKIQDAQVLIICTDGVEQLEQLELLDGLRKKGARVEVATPTGRAIRAWNITDWGETLPADLKIADAKLDDYDALVIPGGVVNPDKLRIDPEAMRVVRAFVDSDKLVAAMCHGPSLLVQADAVEGRQMTSFRSARTSRTQARTGSTSRPSLTAGLLPAATLTICAHLSPRSPSKSRRRAPNGAPASSDHGLRHGFGSSRLPTFSSGGRTTPVLE